MYRSTSIQIIFLIIPFSKNMFGYSRTTAIVDIAYFVPELSKDRKVGDPIFTK